MARKSQSDKDRTLHVQPNRNEHIRIEIRVSEMGETKTSLLWRRDRNRLTRKQKIVWDLGFREGGRWMVLE